jgi:hypothetical protein
LKFRETFVVKYPAQVHEPHRHFLSLFKVPQKPLWWYARGSDHRRGEMATERANDLVAFKKFIDEQLSKSGPELKLDEALARWEDENQTPEKRRETTEARRPGPENKDAGTSRPIEEVLADLRKKHGLTSDPRTLQSNPEEWVIRLRAWVDAQPIRPNKMDDSRESIYAGRGE